MAGQPVQCSDCHPDGTTPEPEPENQPPVADAGPDQTVQVGELVQFSAEGSNDPDGSIVEYAWDFGDGYTEFGITASHTYSNPGTCTVMLTVTDDAGATAADTAVVTVQESIQPSVLNADRVLYITRLKYATSSDDSGRIYNITSGFSDKDLDKAYSVENDSGDHRVISMRINKEAGNYTQVVIHLYVKKLDDGRPQTVTIYPYEGDEKNVQSGYYKDYFLSSRGWTELDVSSLADKMKGFGWMKFRITCSTERFEVSEGNFIVK